MKDCFDVGKGDLWESQLLKISQGNTGQKETRRPLGLCSWDPWLDVFATGITSA